MFDKPSYEVRDHEQEDEVIGEVRRIFDATQGFMWRAWAIRMDSYDSEETLHQTRLGLHEAPEDAEAEIRAYWGIIR